MDLNYLYSDLYSSQPEIIDGQNHTMQSSEFAKYVTETKFTDAQRELLIQSIANKETIRILGLYEGHLDYYVKSKKITILQREDRPTRRKKKFNSKRPFFISIQKLDKAIETWIIVFPSKEYIEQMTELTVSFCYLYLADKQLLNKENEKYLRSIKSTHFPILEKKLAEWSMLSVQLPNFIKKGDIVVLGHVEELANKLIEHRGFENSIHPHKFGIDGIYTLYILKEQNTHKRLILLGFVHSYWGSASGFIAKELAKNKIKTLIYIAKAGTFIAPERIYDVVSPKEYYLLDRDSMYSNWKVTKIEVPILHKGIPIGLLERYESGIHLTVPTVIGETYTQAEGYSKIRPATIDNEISHIAKHINEHNKAKPHDEDINFLCLHFLTDYLHRENDPRKSDVGLASSTNPEAEKKRRTKMSEFLNTASNILQVYTHIYGLQDYTKPEELGEEKHRETLKRIAEGISSGSIKINEAYKSDKFDKNLTFIDRGNPEFAIQVLLGGKDFKSLDVLHKLEVIVIKQKYGLLKEARANWNMSMAMHRDNMNNHLKLDFAIVDIKLRLQEYKIESLEKDCLDLIPALYKAKMESFSPSIYHRAAYASAYMNRITKAISYVNKSLEYSKEKDSHSYNTARHNFIAIKYLSYPDKFEESIISELREIQNNYLDESLKPNFWKANKLKSALPVLFTEGALLLNIDPTKAFKVLCLANYLAPFSGCNQLSEGFADILGLIKKKENRQIIKEFMSSTPPPSKSIIFTRISPAFYYNLIKKVSHIKEISNSSEWNNLFNLINYSK